MHRELLGLAFIVAVHYEDLADRCIQIRVDAKSSIKYVRDRGGASEVMTYLTKIIWGLFIKHRISLSAIVHISGVEMVRIGVDGLSRPPLPKPLSEADRFEWQVTPARWAWITASLAEMGIVLTCDRFACRANCLLPRFCSLTQEPGALSPPNAFTHDWSAEVGWNWAFPPLREVPRVLALLREQRARAVLLVPDWQQHWSALAQQMAHSKPGARAQGVIRLDGDQPFFRCRRNGQWQEVEKFLFQPLLLLIDCS